MIIMLMTGHEKSSGYFVSILNINSRKASPSLEITMKEGLHRHKRMTSWRWQGYPRVTDMVGTVCFVHKNQRDRGW